MNRKICDHLGKEYPSVTAMVKEYGFEHVSLFYHRIAKGWSLEKALTLPIVRTKFELRYKDLYFSSYADLTRKTGVTRRTYLYRKSLGMNLDDIIELSKHGKHAGLLSRDHLGTTYPSLKDMAKAWGMRADTVSKRLNAGATIKQALTLKVWNDRSDRNGQRFGD